MADKMILGDGKNCVYSRDSKKTGLNNNRIVTGPSGCGKTTCFTEIDILESCDTSLIIPVTKRRIVEKYTPVLLERGYDVLDLNFVHPEKGNIGFNPMDYCKNNQDITFLAKSIVLGDPKKEKTTNADPYWDAASTSLLSAEIAYIKEKNKKATFADVLEMHDSLDFSENNGQISTSYDLEFAMLEEENPNSFAVSCYKSFYKLPMRTAGCVYGSLNTMLDNVFSSELRKIFKRGRRVNFEEISQKKTALFITTSPVNPSLNLFINLFYSYAFKQLFEFAENQKNGRLPIPVHVIADDFATGGRIANFPEYISIFREKDISVTLLIQSESQLSKMYGYDNATTIINNCDTYVYMGSNDVLTAQNVSIKANLPLEDVLFLPIGKEIIFRRGQKPIVAQRYNIEKNELYQKITQEYEQSINQERQK